jgi:hypothetical protein
MGLNWEKANKTDLVKEVGSIDKLDGMPKSYSPKKKKPYKFRDIKAKFNSNCAECLMSIRIGEMVRYYHGKRIVTHQSCDLKGLV